ncbi:TPA: 16S rRNA (uracil(1498)-N(3))-methyltransferase, partial [Klebsiella pneumoniae]|nr:16S rRNA (uracil(1498)-N(3))-methyltransferase [Klebsiella pneumoniae]
MQQYFIKGKAEKEVTITDKDTIKHMFQVMRLADEAEVILVFDD